MLAAAAASRAQPSVGSDPAATARPTESEATGPGLTAAPDTTTEIPTAMIEQD